jgi:rubrerythrin/rhodanese-related sulfurtransferase
MPGYISSEKLEALIQKGREKAFLIVDVRKPGEYCLDHIPGAINIPVWEIDKQGIVDKGKSLVIFYCRNGSRSKVAALIALESGLEDERILTLEGGMSAYTGEILLEQPKLELFTTVTEPGSALAFALNLEKGAFRFYQYAARIYQNTSIYEFMKEMAAYEMAHARNLYTELSRIEPQQSLFDAFFEASSGDILEGGKPFEEIQTWLAKTSGDIDGVLDLAMEIELAAYDLYKTMVSHVHDQAMKSCFLELAGAEKTHMRKIMDLIRLRES